MKQLRRDGTASLACVLPILPGKQEAWRRFCQALEGSRHDEYEWSRQRLGIIKECICFAQMTQGEMAIVYLEMERPERVIAQLATSSVPFDCWFRSQLLDLHGFDVSQMLSKPCSEVMFLWQAS